MVIKEIYNCKIKNPQLYQECSENLLLYEINKIITDSYSCDKQTKIYNNYFLCDYCDQGSLKTFLELQRKNRKNPDWVFTNY
jgi:hypothetical protein